MQEKASKMRRNSDKQGDFVIKVHAYPKPLYSFGYNTYIHYASTPKNRLGTYVGNAWNALLGTCAFHRGNRGGCILACGCKTRMHVFYVSYVPNVLYVFLRFARSLRFLGGDAKRRVDANPGCKFSTRFPRIVRFLRIEPCFLTHEQRCTALQLSR